MKRIIIFISLLISFLFFTNVQTANGNDPLIKLYNDLFKTLSKELIVENKELESFSLLMKKYTNQVKIDLGMSSSKSIANIAIVNASLIVGYARGMGERILSDSSINFVMNNYETLYRPIYLYDFPAKNSNKDPKHIYKNNILPIYFKSARFDKVEEDFSKLLETSGLLIKGRILVLNATTGIASGVAAAQGDTFLKKSHLEVAKKEFCDRWPKCKDMADTGLFHFYRHYQAKIKEISLGE